MSKERKITITKHKFGDESEKLQIREWQLLGPTAIWNCTFELIDQWFEMHGIDPSTQKIDRSKISIVKAPWIENNEVKENV